MDPDAGTRLDSLGEDLVLLSVTPDAGWIGTAQRIGFGLMGSELVRLAAAGAYPHRREPHHRPGSRAVAAAVEAAHHAAADGGADAHGHH